MVKSPEQLDLPSEIAFALLYTIQIHLKKLGQHPCITVKYVHVQLLKSIHSFYGQELWSVYILACTYL